MDGLHEMTAAGVAVEIAGQTYQLRPLRARDWGEAARRLASMKRPPLEVLRDAKVRDLPDEALRHLVELAWQDERCGELIPPQEIDRWFRRGDGAAFEFWLMIRQAHPEIGLERAEQLYDLARREQAGRSVLDGQASLNQGHVLGNSPSPARDAAAGHAPDPFPGGASSAA